MSPAPCGCDVVARADAMQDPRGAQVLRDRGQELRAAWGCDVPQRQGREKDCAAACAAVSRLARAEASPRHGCPLRALRSPDLASAALAHRWWKRGELATYLGGHARCTAALAEAVDLIETSLRAREADELDRARKPTGARPGRRGPR